MTTGHSTGTSYSLPSRGAVVRKVERATAGAVGAEYIMKSAWHPDDRRLEAKIYKYLKEKQLTGTPGIADFLVGQDVTFTNKDVATHGMRIP
ncbi:uncharacterized protein PHACADRAFT_253147 [Phanerochaete carnosa HHB-10118-sp]|uniref:Uncharacterized protein n=1 Tax=Phanerochaete carnosa (strain HHB-10118-sp) TaxID=650164 RepID=K5X706_PHACS|nr:uncharacterized protein PHACADRAFT_253147 [Phanerochaete carnosa HHB-10118-sp]EKM58662.1 hypothetical protein PHACADRAFT_253147 [Phanerochaete carnosa HHB-10118-sp]